MKLNNKHNLFIEAYLINGYNATDAYLTAYPKVCYDTANTNGARLLAKACIKEVIEAKKKELANTCNVTKAQIANVMLSIMDDETTKKNDRIKAGEVLNKMFGYNAPIEQNISLNVEQPLFPDVDD